MFRNASIAKQMGETFYMISVSLLFFYVLIGGRGEALLQIPHYERIFKVIFYPTLGLASLLLFPSHIRWVLGFFLLWGLTLFHSYVNFFDPLSIWPDLYQDRLLAPLVSARWSMTVAITESRHLLGYTLVFLPVFFVLKERNRNRLLQVLGLCVFANLVLAGVQQFVNAEILSAGSGTAVAAKRVPGFLEDSGAFSSFLGMLTCGLLWIVVFSKMHVFVRLTLSIFTLGLFFLGFLGCGRVFVLSTAVCIVLSVFVSLFLIFRQRSIRFGLLTFLLIGVFASFFFYLSANTDTYALRNIKSWNLEMLSSFEALERVVDYQRVKGVLAMLENAKQTFPFGSGLGSFHSFCNNAMSKFAWKDVFVDWPSSFYLQMVSELGFAGILFLLCLALIFFNGLKQKKTNPLHVFVLGAFFGLLEGWVIGIHYIFPSIALCLGFILAYLCSELEGKLKVYTKSVFSVACLALFVSSIRTSLL